MSTPASPPTSLPPLLIACGALSHEIIALKKLNHWLHLKVQCLPAELHNRPDKIPEKMAEAIKKAKAKGYTRIYAGYADCGTGGQLDKLLRREGVERLPGAHCYAFFSGQSAFDALQEQELGTFYLTDFLTRHFDRLIIKGLWLDKHPELMPMYFGHYTKLVYLAQTNNAELDLLAQQAAQHLNLRYERHQVGYGELSSSLVHWLSPSHTNPKEQPDG